MKQDFHELAGRIEGAARALLLLVARLESSGALDGQQYSDDLQLVARLLHAPEPQMCATKKTLNELAQALEADRKLSDSSFPLKPQPIDGALRLLSNQVKRRCCGTHHECIYVLDWHRRH